MEFNIQEKPDKYREAIRRWVLAYDWSIALSYTFTFSEIIAASEKWTMKNTQYFFNCVDRGVYRTLQRRKGLRCQRFNILEQGKQGENFHIHGIIAVPTDDKAKPEYRSLNGLRGLMRHVWLNKMICNRQIIPHRFEIKDVNFGSYSPEKWISYITKDVNQGDFETSNLAVPGSIRFGATHLR
ncbi:MAG: hypothetical protein HWE30_02270 [Methylocystaceae bacterium]|nr:hypothetical protein [Methylocystaceae bacterium]